MASNTNSLPIPEIDGADYEYWSIKMKTLLMDKYLWDIVEDGYLEPVDWSLLTDAAKIIKEEQKKNCLTLYHLQSALDKSIFPRIAGCKSATEAWKALQEGYKGSNQVKEIKLQTLRREFGNLRM